MSSPLHLLLSTHTMPPKRTHTPSTPTPPAKRPRLTHTPSLLSESTQQLIENLCADPVQYRIDASQYKPHELIIAAHTKLAYLCDRSPVIRGGDPPLIIDLNDEVTTSSFKPVPFEDVRLFTLLNHDRLFINYQGSSMIESLQHSRYAKVKALLLRELVVETDIQLEHILALVYPNSMWPTTRDHIKTHARKLITTETEKMWSRMLLCACTIGDPGLISTMVDLRLEGCPLQPGTLARGLVTAVYSCSIEAVKYLLDLFQQLATHTFKAEWYARGIMVAVAESDNNQAFATLLRGLACDWSDDDNTFVQIQKTECNLGTEALLLVIEACARSQTSMLDILVDHLQSAQCVFGPEYGSSILTACDRGHIQAACFLLKTYIIPHDQLKLFLKAARGSGGERHSLPRLRMIPTSLLPEKEGSTQLLEAIMLSSAKYLIEQFESTIGVAQTAAIITAWPGARS